MGVESDLDLLFTERRCNVVIEFSDGSVIKCISTLNKEELSSLGLDYLDQLVDLITRRVIPFEILLQNKVTVTKEGKCTIDPLDQLFSNIIKSTWERV